MNINEVINKEKKFSTETEEHSKRVADYSCIIAMKVGFSIEKVEMLKTAALLHDIGKMEIPSEIIHKDGALNDDEFSIIKKHISKGAEIINDVEFDNNNTADIAKSVALQHHEKWDGSGYLGLSGEDTTKEARIVAVADVFDALSSSRSYKDGWDEDEILNEIIKGKGTHFDPDVVDAFLESYQEILKIK